MSQKETNNELLDENPYMYIRPGCAESGIKQFTQLDSSALRIVSSTIQGKSTNALSTMKFINLALALFCAVAYAAAQAELEEPQESYIPARFRRQTEPRGSVSVQATKPMSGPDRRPSVDVDYHQRIFERNGANANAYGGLNIRPGQSPQPHIGIQAERNYRNGFVRGFGQVERGHGGRPSPTFGVSGGFRFRRDVDFELGDQELY
ncbi:hymenoptaecin [Lasioglossum baleicum]|uniref:hymenoptaecin n=1 Tax=Lasioglossum baleicum TaxID=434251 RepID=UPI003FCC639F